MALFKILKGENANLGKTGNTTQYAHEGYAYFVTDTGKMYIDISGNGTSDAAVVGTNRIELNAGTADKLASITDKTIANTDKLAIIDSSGVVHSSSITFDGSTTTQALTKKGTWATFNNYSLPVTKYNQLGGVKPWYSHTVASSGPTEGSNATSVSVNAITTTVGKYYAVESDSTGRLFVNVPWVNTQMTQGWAALAGTSYTNTYPILASATTGSSAYTGLGLRIEALQIKPDTGDLTHTGILYNAGSLILNASTQTNNIYFDYGSNGHVGRIYYNKGDSTSGINASGITFVEYSYNSTVSPTPLDKYEYYYLPSCTADRTDNAGYAIITTKNLSSITTVGTLTAGSIPWSLLTSVPSASSSAAGITKVGASGGAAAYSHSHTASDLPTATTSAKGIMQVGTGLGVSSGTVSVTYGTAANTACQGNDSRLSDARTPTTHTHNVTDLTSSGASRLVWINANGNGFAGNHYVTSTTMSIASTSAPTSGYTLKVGGHTEIVGALALQDQGARTQSVYFKHNASGSPTVLGRIYYDAGSTSNITGSQMVFQEYSYSSTPGTTASSYYESYLLPACAADRTGNASFWIITGKNLSEITQVGTLTAGSIPWSLLTSVPSASSSAAGITKVGASGGAAAYSHSHAAADLPTATTGALGIMKVGTGLSVSSGTVSVSYGTTASTACVGNDSRLSDARTPTAHTHAIADVTSSNSSRLAYTTSEGKLYAGYHYVDNSTVTIGANSAPSSGYTFKVDGKSQLSGDIYVSGTMTSTGSTVTTNAYLDGSLYVRPAAGQTKNIYFQHYPSGGSANTVGRIYYNSGSASTITASQFCFLQYSYASGGSAPNSYYDGFYLPATAAGKTGNGGFYIITQKNLSDITSIATTGANTMTYKNNTAANYALNIERCKTDDTPMACGVLKMTCGGANLGFFYIDTAGTASSNGIFRLNLGNGTATGNDGNYYGCIRMYHPGTVYTDITSTAGTLGGSSGVNFVNFSRAIKATSVYGAVWNDYAEFRTSVAGHVEHGRCVIDLDNGKLELSTKRLQPGAQVTSDTFGFAIGETEEANIPVAVSGRVLVYPYRDRSEYHAGMAVCSAPNGTVDIMTREEIMMYPDCIVGIVSEIPDYETWGSGDVPVNGRIWVRVK